MKTQLLAFGLLLTGPLAGHGQALLAGVPRSEKAYFTADFKRTTSPDSAAYRAETIYRDSLSGITRVYYASGSLKQFASYANVRRGILHGTYSTWYEDGQIHTKEDYLNGVRHGELLTYYPNGSLKRQDRYEDGRCGVGACYGPDGSPMPYFTYEQLPLYPGGDARLSKELREGIRLNNKESMAIWREAIVINNSMKRVGNQTVSQVWKCQVDVELAVNPQGRITNARVRQSPTPTLNNAALRAVHGLKSQFVPARRDGQTVACLLTVPVYYTVLLPTEPQKRVKEVPSNTL